MSVQKNHPSFCAWYLDVRVSWERPHICIHKTRALDSQIHKNKSRVQIWFSKNMKVIPKVQSINSTQFSSGKFSLNLYKLIHSQQSSQVTQFSVHNLCSNLTFSAEWVKTQSKPPTYSIYCGAAIWSLERDANQEMCIHFVLLDLKHPGRDCQFVVSSQEKWELRSV